MAEMLAAIFASLPPKAVRRHHQPIGTRPPQHHQRRARFLEDRVRRTDPGTDSLLADGRRRRRGAALHRTRAGEGALDRRRRRRRRSADSPGDPTRFGQIVSNLVNNALKFTERGGVLVHLRMTQHAERGRVLELSVRDSGSGSASPTCPTSSRASGRPTRRSQGGSAEPVSASRSRERLVRAMDGEIGVESQPGVGSTFRFRFAPNVLEEARPASDCGSGGSP